MSGSDFYQVVQGLCQGNRILFKMIKKDVTQADPSGEFCEIRACGSKGTCVNTEEQSEANGASQHVT